jgi:very-short-patch-repair endonuclease
LKEWSNIPSLSNKGTGTACTKSLANQSWGCLKGGVFCATISAMYKKASIKPLKSIRQKLRNNATPAERLLWQYLKKSQLNNKKFIRQYSLGNYIYDFYCAKEKLLIELDGEAIHADIKVNIKDIEKELYAINLGMKVLRFSNRDVFNNLNEVLEEIQSHFRY